jgi:hypothetical protein
MNSRERFLRTLDFETVNPPWIRCTLGMWEETIERWRAEGWDGTRLEDIFGIDYVTRVDPYYGPVPPFAHEVVSEDEHTIVYVNPKASSCASSR